MDEGAVEVDVTEETCVVEEEAMKVDFGGEAEVLSSPGLVTKLSFSEVFAFLNAGPSSVDLCEEMVAGEAKRPPVAVEGAGVARREEE